jgi:competence protein ComGC
MSIENTPPGIPAPKTNKLAVTSLVLGILSLVLCVVGFVFAIPGLICGIMGLSRVKKSGGFEKGQGLAITGAVLSGVALVLTPIIGLLAAIAVPNFIKARDASMHNACIANLRIIDSAKATWALENKKTEGELPTETDLIGPDKYMMAKPTCPAGGSYSLNPVGAKPTCTVPKHWF